MRWLYHYRIHLALFVIGLVAFGMVAGSRLTRQSTDPHFVLLADAWLHGRLDIDPAKKIGDDWASVDTAELRDGTLVRGRRLQSRPVFRTLGGEDIPLSHVRRTAETTYYVSFPPFPALLMMPLAAISGHRANDVVPTVLMAALVLPLMFAVLGRIRERGGCERTPAEATWLALTLAFGTVFFFSAVQGRVWFTAHVIGVVLALAYLWCAIGAERPILAGICLGLATLTRTPLAFMFPLFALEAWRMSEGKLVPFARKAAAFAAPIVIIAAAAMIHNYIRFESPTEFGHSYLAVRQQAQMEACGLFSYQYLSRNLTVALTLLPGIIEKPPYLALSGHGMAIWVTTPIVLLLLWPKQKPYLHRSLWLTVALIAVPTFFYQNSGWFQFGYRFSLDYMPFLLVLLAIGGRPLTRTVKVLMIVGIAINLFGAVTFGRDYRYYRADRSAYDVVIRH